MTGNDLRRKQVSEKWKNYRAALKKRNISLDDLSLTKINYKAIFPKNESNTEDENNEVQDDTESAANGQGQIS